MKKNPKAGPDVLELLTKMQEQLIFLDKKIDSLISRSVPAAVAPVKPLVPKPTAPNVQTPRPPNEHHQGKPMHPAVCADCKKDCTVPFKPSGDRPVYCKECFSRRKSGGVAKVSLNDKPIEAAAPVQIVKEVPARPLVKDKKKSAPVKKPVAGKKKVVAKKKTGK